VEFFAVDSHRRSGLQHLPRIFAVQPRDVTLTRPTDYASGHSGIHAAMTDTRVRTRGGRLRMQRSRGAMSGLLLILLGVWGALIPFVGPYFDFAFTPDQPWAWTDARGWLEVLPGAVAVIGGLLLLGSRNRATATLGGWLGVIAGAWFVVGRAAAGLFGIGDVGSPVAATETKSVVLELAYFYGLGALIIFLGAAALGRISVRSVRDVEVIESPMATTVEPQPAVRDQQTEVVGPDANRRHRGLRGLFGRRHTHAH
jgi:hypothetical protein